MGRNLANVVHVGTSECKESSSDEGIQAEGKFYMGNEESTQIFRYFTSIFTDL